MCLYCKEVANSTAISSPDLFCENMSEWVVQFVMKDKQWLAWWADFAQLCGIFNK